MPMLFIYIYVSAATGEKNGIINNTLFLYPKVSG